MKRYFLGIDIGTFESRGILIDESFRVAADASVPHGMDNPQPGWFEQDAEAVWWGDLCKLCRTLIKQSGIRPEQIACVGTSALGTDCLPVDEQGRPLRPAILYGIDARASEEAAWLTEHYGQARVQELFGHLGLVQPVESRLLGIAGTLSGCGPAFVSMFIEALGDAGVKHGLPRAMAYRLAGQMVAGTGRMQVETGAHPGAMKDAVCSPGGTTIVGVAELERGGMRAAVINAVDAIQNK